MINAHQGPAINYMSIDFRTDIAIFDKAIFLLESGHTERQTDRQEKSQKQTDHYINTSTTSGLGNKTSRKYQRSGSALYLSSVHDIFHRLCDLLGCFDELFLTLGVGERRRNNLGAGDQLRRGESALRRRANDGVLVRLIVTLV